MLLTFRRAGNIETVSNIVVYFVVLKASYFQFIAYSFSCVYLQQPPDFVLNTVCRQKMCSQFEYPYLA
jgi:hypothetical protein